MSTSVGNVEPLSCKELVELVTDYLDGALPAADRLRFEEHLADCDDCPRYLRQIELTVLLTGSLTEQSIPVDAKDRLLDVFRRWHEDEHPRSPGS